MEEWTVLIPEIEKRYGSKVLGHFVFEHSSDKENYLRKIAYIVGVLSQYYVIKRKFPTFKLEGNSLYILKKEYSELSKKIDEFIVSYRWLSSFHKKLNVLCEKLEQRRFKVSLIEMVEVVGRLYLNQFFVLHKLMTFKKYLEKTLDVTIPEIYPSKPSYSTFLIQVVASGQSVDDHPIFRMVAGAKAYKQLSDRIQNDESLTSIYDVQKKLLDTKNQKNIEFLKRVQEPYSHLLIWFYKTTSDLMAFFEWENYYTFNVREHILGEIENLVDLTSSVEENIKNVIKYVERNTGPVLS